MCIYVSLCVYVCVCVLVSFCVSMTKIPNKKDLEEKTFYLKLMVSEISAHRQPTSLLWTQGKTEHHDGSIVEGSCSPHGSQEADEERADGKVHPPRVHTPVTHLLQLHSTWLLLPPS